MAATPTEVLNDDIKELKGEIRENRTKIDLVWNEVQRLAIAQAQMRAELREDIQRVTLSQAEMKTELLEHNHKIALSQAEMKTELLEDNHKLARTQDGIKGEFRFVKLLLSLVLAGIAGAAWQFYGLNARVNVIETKVIGIEERLDKVDARFDKVDAKFDKVDARFERLESLLSKILEQTKALVQNKLVGSGQKRPSIPSDPEGNSPTYFGPGPKSPVPARSSPATP